MMFIIPFDTVRTKFSVTTVNKCTFRFLVVESIGMCQRILFPCRIVSDAAIKLNVEHAKLLFIVGKQSLRFLSTRNRKHQI